jgi:hypothetical protein
MDRRNFLRGLITTSAILPVSTVTYFDMGRRLRKPGDGYVMGSGAYTRCIEDIGLSLLAGYGYTYGFGSGLWEAHAR